MQKRQRSQYDQTTKTKIQNETRSYVKDQLMPKVHSTQRMVAKHNHKRVWTKEEKWSKSNFSFLTNAQAMWASTSRRRGCSQDTVLMGVVTSWLDSINYITRIVAQKEGRQIWRTIYEPWTTPSSMIAGILILKRWSKIRWCIIGNSDGQRIDVIFIIEMRGSLFLINTDSLARFCRHSRILIGGICERITLVFIIRTRGIFFAPCLLLLLLPILKQLLTQKIGHWP